MSELNIYQRINAVMKDVEYVKKDSAIQGYKAVSHDMVTAVLRKSMVKHGIVVRLEQTASELIEKRDKANGISMHLYSGDYAVHFVNIDKPEDFATVSINAHANDNGDKAPGKSASYATKYAMLKIFSLETGENDESRTYEPEKYTEAQKAQFDELVESGNALAYLEFSQMVGPEAMIDLANTFPDGQKTAGKAKLRELEKSAWDTIEEYGALITEYCDKRDETALMQMVDELTPFEKRLVQNKITKHEIDYIKKVKSAQ